MPQDETTAQTVWVVQARALVRGGGVLSAMACSIKGDVKKILLPRPEGGKISATSSPSHGEDACRVLCPWIGFALFDLSSLHLLLVATTPIGFRNYASPAVVRCQPWVYLRLVA